MDKRTMGMWFKSALISGAFCMSGVLTGCGSDEPAGDVNFVNGADDFASEIDQEVINKFVTSSEPLTYGVEEISLFDKNDNTNGMWKQINLSELFGWTSSFPKTLSFYQGKMYSELRYFSPSGPSILYTPVRAYEKVTGKKVGLFMLYDLSHDGKVLSNPSVSPALVKMRRCSSEGISMSCEGRYEGGETHNGGMYLEVYDCIPEKTWWWPVDDSKLIICGHTMREIVTEFASVLREQFGEEIPVEYGMYGNRAFRIQDLLDALDRKDAAVFF